MTFTVSTLRNFAIATLHIALCVCVGGGGAGRGHGSMTSGHSDYNLMRMAFYLCL